MIDRVTEEYLDKFLRIGRFTQDQYDSMHPEDIALAIEIANRIAMEPFMVSIQEVGLGMRGHEDPVKVMDEVLARK